jgi:hypothetical protein
LFNLYAHNHSTKESYHSIVNFFACHNGFTLGLDVVVICVEVGVDQTVFELPSPSNETTQPKVNSSSPPSPQFLPFINAFLDLAKTAKS